MARAANCGLFIAKKTDTLTEQLHLAEMTTQVGNLATEVGKYIRAELGSVTSDAVDEKGLNSLVSYVDKQAEEKLVDGLRSLIPQATFLTEEETVEQSTGFYRWIIDPLDGTTNFLFGLPHFSVSIALERDGVLVLGVVYEAYHGELFTAWQGGGAFSNGRPIRVRQNPELARSLLATGFPYTVFEEMPQYLRLFEHLMRHTRGLRRFGSAALDLAYVAAGRYDGYFEKSINAWDIAGGIVLVQEAGGVVTDFRGGNGAFRTGEVVAASSALHPQLLRAVEVHFV